MYVTCILFRYLATISINALDFDLNVIKTIAESIETTLLSVHTNIRNYSVHLSDKHIGLARTRRLKDPVLKLCALEIR